MCFLIGNSTITWKRRQRTLRERKTFAFGLRRFWVSLWTLESEVREWDLFIFLRYHGKWIDSVWKSRFYNGALKENPIHPYIFWKLNSYRKQSYFWNVLKSHRCSDMKKKSPETLLRLNWFASARELSEQRGQHRKCFIHTSPSIRVPAIFQMWFGFFILHPHKVWYSKRERFLSLNRP